MDLIGSVKYIENGPSGRKSNYGKERSAKKNAHIKAVDGKKDQTNPQHFSADDDTRLGRKVDITV